MTFFAYPDTFLDCSDTAEKSVLTPKWAVLIVWAMSERLCSDKDSSVKTAFWQILQVSKQCSDIWTKCQNSVLTSGPSVKPVFWHLDQVSKRRSDKLVSVLTNRRSVKTPFWQNLIAKSQVQRPSERRSDTVLRCQNSQVGCQDRGVLTTLTLSWHS